ncbi:YkvA family protein [Intrasporangium sp. DVR]|uniref:YkvA family protein n=1 Tax=Intrasporangium sp. DVR TaxID=3127867 RepID=UPI00313A4E4B
MKAASRLKLLATTASVIRASTRPGAPSLTVRVQAVPRLVRATLSGQYAGTTRGRLGMLAAAVAYIVSPVDLVPEAVLPVVGAADDAVVISWAVKTLVEETDRFLTWEAGQGRRTPPRAERASAGRVRPLGSPASDGVHEVAATGAGPRLTHHAREAATTYVLETVRKRLER